MTCAWLRGAALAGVLLLAACGRGGGDDVDASVAAENLREAEAFLERNASADGVQTLPSGLQYKVIRAAPEGAESPDGNDLVRVHYEGALIDGTVFDSSYERGAPYVTTPEQVVAGWTEALQRMKVGDEWMLYVPPALGYEDRWQGPQIPPNSVLVFRMELLAVAKAPGAGSANTARV
ncbi:FKBP-type peptidyl-prolyl cis-trans isomerase [Brevundimonas sp.]|uniref:FKBP-type peptidyl-prolyl cis-trans isomerase n=1 Tax=Brevundimonas sp. TaxID=1871086 RepID=UPI0035B3C248